MEPCETFVWDQFVIYDFVANWSDKLCSSSFITTNIMTTKFTGGHFPAEIIL